MITALRFRMAVGKWWHVGNITSDEYKHEGIFSEKDCLK